MIPGANIGSGIPEGVICITLASISMGYSGLVEYIIEQVPASITDGPTTQKCNASFSPLVKYPSTTRPVISRYVDWLSWLCVA
jgi:hypothetical protein